MKHLAYLVEHSWEMNETKSASKPRSYKPRIRNQDPITALIKVLIVLIMGLAAIIRFVLAMVDSL